MSVGRGGRRSCQCASGVLAVGAEQALIVGTRQRLGRLVPRERVLVAVALRGGAAEVCMAHNRRYMVERYRRRVFLGAAIGANK